MTIDVDGMPILVEFISRNNNTLLYARVDTKVKEGYLYNVYSHQLGFSSYQGIIKFHKKLKIYKCESYGHYVNCQGSRMYMNSLIKGG